jgi:segregation and condensation protein A
LQQAPASVPLTAWLVQLRARLLVPADPATQQDAIAEADQLRDHLLALQEAQALAGWLEPRPQLGHDVFARGQPEVFGVSVDAEQSVDVIEFLWASLALFDVGAGESDTPSVYRPPLRLELHTVADARQRILQQLAANPEGGPLDRFLPEPLIMEHKSRPALRQRSAWSSTFVASLGLARQGEAALQQEKEFTAINVSSPTGRANGSGGPQ